MEKNIQQNTHDNNTPRFSERRFWTDFLMLYRSQPALWDLSDEKYKDKNAKIKGYTLLTQKLAELIPSATRNDVLRRINIFRTNYRRERVRAITHRERSQHYQTTLWYFNLLSFLEPQMNINCRKRTDVKQLKSEKCEQKLNDHISYETNEPVEYIVYGNDKNDKSKICPVPKKRKKLQEISYEYDNDNNTNVGIIDEHESIEYYVDENSKLHETPKSVSVKGDNDIISCENENTEYVDEIHSEDYEQNLLRRTKRSEYIITDDEVVNDEKNALEYDGIEQQIPSSTSTLNSKVIQPTTSTQFQQIHSNTDTLISTAGEILARSWALQYDEMSTQQKIFARKAIADILFEGCMGTLGTNRS